MRIHDIQRSKVAELSPEISAGCAMTLEDIRAGAGIGLTVDCADCCADCGEPIRIGSWPFCRSATNPQGHETGCYGWHFGGK